MPKWVKQGNFETIHFYGPDIPLERRVTHLNTDENKKIAEFDICGYRDSEEIYIQVHFTDKKFREDLHGACSKEIQTLMDFSIKYHSQEIAGLQTHDKEILKDFLLGMHQLDTFDAQLKEDLAKPPLSIELPPIKDIQELLTAVANANADFNTICSQAKQTNDVHALWTIGQYYEEKMQDTEKAIACYQEIAPESPDYQQANLRLAELILQPLFAAKSQQISLTADEVEEYDSQYFDCMLNAADGNDETQKFVDSIYADRCGEDGFNPTIKKVGRNTPTLIKVAAEMKKLNERVKALEAKNGALEEENAALRKQLASTTNTQTFFSAKHTIDEVDQVEERESKRLKHN
ncbi:MAG: hypothetical protein EPO11_11145 [Gammaproteobacteria bacterium]|nr:MAG: hypothetical protein EPO11_11145 [Gammaproteobacteria bacterium]